MKKCKTKASHIWYKFHQVQLLITPHINSVPNVKIDPLFYQISRNPMYTHTWQLVIHWQIQLKMPYRTFSYGGKNVLIRLLLLLL